jgi:hypothetical protein
MVCLSAWYLFIAWALPHGTDAMLSPLPSCVCTTWWLLMLSWSLAHANWLWTGVGMWTPKWPRTSHCDWSISDTGWMLTTCMPWRSWQLCCIHIGAFFHIIRVNSRHYRWQQKTRQWWVVLLTRWFLAASSKQVVLWCYVAVEWPHDRRWHWLMAATWHDIMWSTCWFLCERTCHVAPRLVKKRFCANGQTI